MLNKPSRDQLTATVISLTLVAVGLILLQGWLVFLWDDRARVGLAMPLNLTVMQEDPIPHLGHWIYFFSLSIFTLGAFSRIAEARPRALAGLAVETASPARWTRSLLILAALYGCLGAGAAVVEHLLYHHFETGPAHHVVIVTVLLGLYYAGQRRPFLHVGLATREGKVGLATQKEKAGRRRRLWANAICVVLFAATYANWIARSSLSTLTRQLDSPRAAFFVVLVITVPLAFLLGWAMLHSSLVGLGARVIGALEARSEVAARDAGRRSGSLGALLEWTAHFGMAALLLGLGYILQQWVHGMWTPGRSMVFLGVDWYFVNSWNAVTAAEVAILPAAALFGGLGIHRALVDHDESTTQAPLQQAS